MSPFGYLNAFALLCLWFWVGSEIGQHRRGATKGSDEMYSTKSINGIPIIQCNGRNLLGVWDRDWQYAKELCDKLNKLRSELNCHLEGGGIGSR